MTKIEEIIREYFTEQSVLMDQILCTSEDLTIVMKEYAEYYAKKCLEIATNEVNCGNAEDFQYDIARKSILNIKLPEHE